MKTPPSATTSQVPEPNSQPAEAQPDTQRMADAAMRLSKSLQEMTAAAQDMAQSLQRAIALLKQQKTDKHTPL